MSTELQEMLSLSFSVCGVEPQGCLEDLPGLTPGFARLAWGMTEGVPVWEEEGTWKDTVEPTQDCISDCLEISGWKLKSWVEVWGDKVCVLISVSSLFWIDRQERIPVGYLESPPPPTWEEIK